MSIEPIDSINLHKNNETTLRIPVNSQVFDYLKSILINLKSSDKPVDDVLKQGLHFFATGESNEHVADLIQSLVTVAPHFIKFPVEEEMLDVQQKFYQLSQTGNADFGFPNVIGVIDCVPVSFRPIDDREVEVYLDHNSEYSINAQLVCGPDLQIYSVLAAFPGKFGNLEIWKNSKLCQELKQCGNTCWLIGDEKYCHQPNLMTPIISPETQPDQLYNDTHTAVYKNIKYCINMLTTRFKCLNALNFNPDHVCAIIIACCVLHNICISHNDLIEIDTSKINSDLQLQRVVHFGHVEDTENCKPCDNENK